jgi:hypothetical protein
MNRSYVISVIIGFVLVVAFYLLSGQSEAFTNPTTTPATAAAATPATAAAAADAAAATPATAAAAADAAAAAAGATDAAALATLRLKTLPLPEKVIMYTELFDTTNLMSGTSWTADIPSDNSKSFSINVPSGSVNIHGGLAMRSTTLIGPSSDMFTFNTDYSLSPFTVAFFGRLNNLDALTSPTTRFVLWSMWAEARPNNPNIVEIAIEGVSSASTGAAGMSNSAPSADAISTNVVLRMTVGVDSMMFPIPRSTLLTGENALYTFTYDNSAANPAFNFYINKATPMAQPYTAPSPSTKIYLGNTNMSVNSIITGISLDMNLYAFIYYGSVLSAADQSNLTDYFMQEVNGISVLLKSQIFDRAAMTSNVNSLKTSLNMCQSKLQATDLATVIKNPWHIALDETEGMSAATLSNMYTANVQTFGSSNPAQPSIPGPPTIVIPPSIAMPANLVSTIISGTTSNQVHGPQINDPAFWKLYTEGV